MCGGGGDYYYPATWAATRRLRGIYLVSGGWTPLCKELVRADGSPHITMQRITVF